MSARDRGASERRPRERGAPRETPGSKPRARSLPPFVAQLPRALLLGLALVTLALLGQQASSAHFATDECFHAHVSRWIAAHGRLPREVAAFYSGFAYYYPPLFHLLGAAATRLAGVAALPYLNVVVTAALLLVAYFGPPPAVPHAPRRWAALLILGNALFAAQAVRFYVESLSALLALGAIVLLLRLRAAPGTRTALALGAVTGLALVAKHTALVLPALLALIAVRDLLTRNRTRALSMSIALAVALAIGAPFFLRNWALYGSPIYPAFAPDLHPQLYALHKQTFGMSPLAFYRAIVMATGLPILALFAAGCWVAFARRERTVVSALLVVCVALVALAPLMPVQDPRHLLPVIGLMALTGSIALYRGLARLRWLAATIEVLLVLAALAFVARLPNYRAAFNAPALLTEAYQAIRENTPEGSMVLSLWTYDTAYASGRPATWPIPWGQKDNPYELFVETDRARMRAALERHGIDYVLMPHTPTHQAFNGSNYNRSFIEGMHALIASGELTTIWRSRELALVECPRRSDPAARP